MPRLAALIALLLFLQSCFPRSYGQSGPEKMTPQFSVSFEVSRSEAKVGSPVLVRILLTNLNDQGFLMDADKGNRGEFDYTIRLLDKDGQEPPRTRYFRAVRGEDSSDSVSESALVVNRSLVPRAIEPRGIYEDKIDLNELYLLKPGSYTLQVGLGAVQDLSKTVWRSSKITLTMTS